MCIYVANGVWHSLGVTFGAYISGKGQYLLLMWRGASQTVWCPCTHYTHAPSPQCWTIVHHYFTFPYHSLPQRLQTEAKVQGLHYLIRERYFRKILRKGYSVNCVSGNFGTTQFCDVHVYVTCEGQMVYTNTTVNMTACQNKCISWFTRKPTECQSQPSFKQWETVT